MNTKDFSVMMDRVVGKVLTQAYIGNGMHSLNCERTQRAFKYVISNGYFKIGVECYGGQIGCWWTGALSLRPHELVLGEMRDICYEKAFCSQVQEFLWACVHKMNALADKRRCSVFSWPAIRPIEEYVEAGGTEAFTPSEETIEEAYGDDMIGDDVVVEEEIDGMTLDDEVAAAMSAAAESDGDELAPDPALDSFLSGNKKKRHGIFGRKKTDTGSDEIASMGDDHVHQELAEDFFEDKFGDIDSADTLEELGDI